MKLKIQRSDLIGALALAHRVAETRAIDEMTSMVLLGTDLAGQLTFEATDLRLGVQGVAKAEVEDPGAICVRARALYDIARKLPEEAVSLETDADSFAIIKSGRATFKLAGRSAGDFPATPDRNGAEPVVIDAQAFAALLEATVYAASGDEGRPHLHGIQLEAEEGRLRAVTTNGHRLSLAEREVDLGGLELLLPLPAAQAILKLIAADGGDVVDFVRSGNHLFFTAGDTTITTKPVDARFPPWRKVVPEAYAESCTVDREVFLDAIRRVALINRDASAGVMMVFGPSSLRLAVDSPVDGFAKDELQAIFTGSEFEVMVNARYLREALEGFDCDEVTIRLTGPTNAIVIVPSSEDGSQLAVVMPMRP